MAGQDNAQIDQEIQNLVNKLDQCIANFDEKRRVLEFAIGAEIKALKKDRDEATEQRSSLLHESVDTSSNPEGGQKTANVKQWLNQKALISAETTGDQDQGNNFSVLIVDDDLRARDTNRVFMMLVGKQKLLRMEVQEAKNGKEAVYLHLAGASFDLILMDNQMPIMTGIQATEQLRKMGVKSQIVGVASESNQKDFIDSGLDSCIQKPLNPAKITAFFPDPSKPIRIDTSSQG
ncbi:unnamed protein product [Dovyalis caffra]|uniref:Response regulatory domain-containing protein n=1 Tax=Dovyalis caffra TaxID=77055 RepID=A0AAV1RK39_9ROSI|nr:unnamed protein product [Dovyalis caffra]